MNYLAHFYLSDRTPEGFVGSLLGDFVKGNLDSFPRILRNEIKIHRSVDSYTDAHPTVKKSKSRIHDNLRRYAGVAVDVFYDHFLIKNWTKYSAKSLTDFVKEVYAALSANRVMLPDNVNQSLSRIVEHNLLMSYQEIDGIERALFRISSRLKRNYNLAESIADLRRDYKEFDSDFNSFFPELIEFVGNQRHQFL